MTTGYRPMIAAFSALFVMLLSACSFKATFKETTDTTSNITGTTSGRIWWNEDGMLRPDHKVAAFTAYNAENLETDAARGQGEYLTSLGRLTATFDGQAFQPAAQDVFSRWSRSPNPSAGDLARDLQTSAR
ncbi:MAG: DUF3015 domain-containing protein [Nitrospira sp. CR1.2]|nr:DUF3015 domain-containing protein [Nitrospira sp. CR1.2]